MARIPSNQMFMHVHRNISYLTAPSHATTSGPQTAHGSGGGAAKYSRIGPSYETLTLGPRRQLQPVSGRDRDFARFSERYEFSEPSHLATGGGGQAMDYEVQCMVMVVYKVQEVKWVDGNCNALQ